MAKLESSYSADMRLNEYLTNIANFQTKRKILSGNDKAI